MSGGARMSKRTKRFKKSRWSRRSRIWEVWEVLEDRVALPNAREQNMHISY